MCHVIEHRQAFMMGGKLVVFLVFVIILRAKQGLAENHCSNGSSMTVGDIDVNLKSDTCSLTVTIPSLNECRKKSESDPDSSGSSGTEDDVKFKTKDTAGESCAAIGDYFVTQFLTPDEISSGSYYVCKEDPFEVNCHFHEKKMCLKYDDSLYTPSVDVGNSSAPFWLSSFFDIYPKFYKMSVKKLLWFQAQAKSVHQTIRFFCKNMNLPPIDEKISLQLLSWNGNIVDFQSTQNNPLYYQMSSEVDSCKTSEEKPLEELFSDIVLKGVHHGDLPIVDFYIRNIKSGKQFMRLQPREFCVVYE